MRRCARMYTHVARSRRRIELQVTIAQAKQVKKKKKEVTRCSCPVMGLAVLCVRVRVQSRTVIPRKSLRDINGYMKSVKLVPRKENFYKIDVASDYPQYQFS